MYEYILFLRRHYPDQVHRVGATLAPSQPLLRELPVSVKLCETQHTRFSGQPSTPELHRRAFTLKRSTKPAAGAAAGFVGLEEVYTWPQKSRSPALEGVQQLLAGVLTALTGFGAGSAVLHGVCVLLALRPAQAAGLYAGFEDHRPHPRVPGELS